MLSTVTRDTESAQESLSVLNAPEFEAVLARTLCEGTALAVPQRLHNERGAFSP